jgi:hypothetical protein
VSAPAVPGGARRRFPGYDVLGQVRYWDEVTTGVVLNRLGPPPDLRFFTDAEQAVAGPLLDHLMAQEEEPKIPLLRMVDARLAEGQTDGWRYEDMPEDPEAWRRALAGLDEDARELFAKPFHECDDDTRRALISAVQKNDGDWHGMPAKHVWSLWSRYASTAFYSHPWAWNEIGFGGPAYPRGYKNAGVGALEPWEVPDADPRDPMQHGAGQ